MVKKLRIWYQQYLENSVSKKLKMKISKGVASTLRKQLKMIKR